MSSDATQPFFKGNTINKAEYSLDEVPLLRRISFAILFSSLLLVAKPLIKPPVRIFTGHLGIYREDRLVSTLTCTEVLSPIFLYIWKQEYLMFLTLLWITRRFFRR